MIRLISLLFCLIPIFSWSQGDTSDVEIDSTILQADFVPLKFNGKWLWYDIVNNRASDSIYITDFAQKESGFYSIYIVKDSSHWGILNLTGEIVRPFAFDSIILIQNHLFTLFNDEWSYHYSDELVGDSLIPVSFDSLHTYGRDLYLFNEGKTGLILRDGTIISPIYDGIHSFECTTGMGYDGYYISLEGSEYNLLNFGGQELLPKGIWDLRCTEDAIFEFRRGKNPEYYLPYLDEIVSPVGRDIVFYEDRGYKIYTEDKSRSALHLSNGEVLKDQYDDYFLLANDYIAVRKNGKVGLTRNGTQVLGEVKYDQVNPIISPIYENEDYRWYFKFYIGDSCGLMNDQGQEMFDARYANVLTTADDNRFIVLDGNLSGVVDGTGRTVIPLKYNRLSYENGSKQFIVQHNTKVGLFDYNGKQRTPIVYDGYSRLQTFTDGENSDALLVLKKGATYYFANSSGFIDGAGFDHYNYSTDVLKTYSSKAISVFLFDQMGRIEELSNYPIYRNAVIRRNYHDAMNSVGHWANSELEENQQEGYFGLRYYQKRGFGVLPSYRTVRTAIFSDYLAEVEAEKVNFQLTKELSAEVVGGFHHLTLGSGKTNGVSYFSSELSIIKGGSGDRFVNRTADGGQDHAYSKDIESGFIDLSERVHYSDEAGSQSRYRRYFKGGEVELCPIDSSDVSFYDYFKYHNSVDGCRVTPEVMKMILNPKIGVRFKNSRCEIINASVYGLYAGYKTYKSAKGFEKYNYVNRFIFHEKPLDSETGSLQFDYLPRKDEEEVFVDNVLDVSIAQGLFVESNGSYIQTKVNVT